MDWYRAIVSGEKRGILATILRCVLWLVSMVYGFVVRVRNVLYDLGCRRVHRAEVPVICVGNLTLGGTGKTPAIEYLARMFNKLGVRVAILSRGYGQLAGKNDEAILLEENLPEVPHLQGKDRCMLAAKAVREYQSELILMDDGFQHRRLYRDLNILLVDASLPWGYGYLFPRGMLREPKGGMRRADIILLTHCDQINETELNKLKAEIDRVQPGLPIVASVHVPLYLINSAGERTELGDLSGRDVAAFCGIGNPQGFYRTVEGIAGEIVGFRTYPDHHHYQEQDMQNLENWAESLPSDCPILTTQKDLVKIRKSKLGARPLWAVKIALQIRAREDILQQKLMEVLTCHPGTGSQRSQAFQV